MLKQSIVMLDFETTGLSPANGDRITEVAALRLRKSPPGVAVSSQRRAFPAPTAARAAAASRLSAASSRAELLVQGRALLGVGRAAEVSEALQTWVVGHPRDALAWQLLAEAWTRQGQTSRAIRADAESRVAQLDYAAALDRLKAAQEILRRGSESAGRNTHIESSIVDTRTRQVAALLREQTLEDKVDRKLQR